MQINVVPIVRPIPLREYAPEYEAITVWCRVNPSRATLDQFTQLQEEMRCIEQDQQELEAQLQQTPLEPQALQALLGPLVEQMRHNSQQTFGWYAVLWSEGKDPATHWTAEGVQALASNQDEPALWLWLCQRSWDLINEHRATRKKVSAPRSVSLPSAVR
jgi:hypothetical protein